MKAAATPSDTANMIENNPYRIGVSSESFLINFYKEFKF